MCLDYCPEVLIYDETRFRMDPSRKHLLFELIQHIQERNHLALVYFTYNMQFVCQDCTHVGVLDHGEIIEQGRVVDILQNPKKELTKHLVQTMHENGRLF